MINKLRLLLITILVTLFTNAQTASISTHYLGADVSYTQSTDASLITGFYYGEALAFKYNIEATVYDSPAHAFATGAVSETGRCEFGIYFQTQSWGLHNVFEIPSSDPTPDLTDPAVQAENYARHVKWFYQRHGHIPASVAYQGGGGAPSTTGKLFNYMLAGRTSSMQDYNTLPAIWADDNLSSVTKYYQVSTRFGDDTGATPIINAMNVFESAINSNGWYRDFCHWHSNPRFSNGKLYEFYNESRLKIDAHPEKKIVTVGSGTRAQHAWLREITSTYIVDNSGSLALSVTYTVPFWMNNSWTFDGFTSKPVNAFIIPASVSIDVTGTSLAGSELTAIGAVSLRKTAPNKFVVEVPFNRVSETVNITLSATTNPNYANDNLPVINTITNNGTNWDVTTDQPTKLVLFKLPVGETLADIEAKNSANKVFAPIRQNTLSTMHNLTVTDYSSYDYYVGVITETKQSILKRLEVYTSQSCVVTVPSNLSGLNITSNSTDLIWDAVASATYDLRYKATSNSTWINITNISTNNYTLGSLSADTQYEVQVRSKCANANTSTYTNSLTFNTLSVVCNAIIPTNISLSNVLQTTAIANWDAIANAMYNIRYKEVIGSTWTIIPNITSNSYSITSLNPDTQYEVQVQSLCPDTSTSGYSSSINFSTLPETGYCSSQGLDSSEEYISFFRINGQPNSSGASGYSDFTSTTFQATKGETNLGVILATTTSSQSRGFRVWIDYNNDGVFDDSASSTEVIYNVTSSNTSNYMSFTIPSAVTLGVKNMRVSMKRGGVSTPCEVFNFGEVEDYTINIIDINSCNNDTTAPVADVATLSTINSQCEVTTLTIPTAIDDCVGNVSGTTTATLPITVSTTITWTYTDGTNISTQTQEVVINDTTGPIVDVANLPDIISSNDITNLSSPTATDNCIGTIIGTTITTLPITVNTTITWTYTDGTNITTQMQEVIINNTPICTASVPINSVISNIQTNSVLVSWDAIANAMYNIRYKEVTGSTWTIIPNITSNSYSITSLNPDTQYEVQVQSLCPDTSTSGYSSSINFSTLPETGYCSSQGLDSSEEYISFFRINGQPNSSGASGYSDFTSTTFQATKGETNLGVILATTTSSQSRGFRVWIDYNNDGVFDDSASSTEIIYSVTSSNTSNYMSFTIPSTVTLGVKNMRVSMKRGGVSTPCEVFNFGEVEDYTINIIDGDILKNINLLNLNNSKIRAYPNPTSNVVTFDLGSVYNDISIELINSFGTQIKKYNFNLKRNIKININEVSSGSYIFRIFIDKKIKHLKINKI